MGLEAYRIILKPISNNNIEDIIDIFSKLGFIITNQNSNNFYLEKLNLNGYIEIELSNQAFGNFSLNKYIVHKNKKEFTKMGELENKERVLVQIQIAKPNHQNIIDFLIKDIKSLNDIIPVTVINMQTKMKIDLNSCEDLKKHYKIIKDAFEEWYPNIPYPIRCREVFETDRKINKKD